MPTLVDHGINDIERTSIYWRQLIIFNMNYKTLKSKLEEIADLVEFDLPSELVVTSKLANGEFVPLTGAISCPWLDKDDYIHFNVGYNKVNNKCLKKSIKIHKHVTLKGFNKTKIIVDFKLKFLGSLSKILNKTFLNIIG